MESSSIKNLKKPIVLVGMMGVGKTTYGRKLANLLKVYFADIDQAIEQDIGHSVSWIFENAGEAEFRKLEHNKILELVGRKELMIIALGGGAFISEKNREFIKTNAISVWLSCPAEIIYSRVSARKDRPLLEGNEDKLNKIKDIIATREKFYSECNIKIETDNYNPKDILYKIIETIENYI